MGFPCGSAGKDPPAMQETWVWSLGWEDPLEKGKATHSSILSWRIPWTIQSVGLQRVRHDWATFTSTSLHCIAQRTRYSVLCGDQNGKEIQGKGDICIHVADSLCCTAETNTTLQSTYTLSTKIKNKTKRPRKVILDTNSSRNQIILVLLSISFPIPLPLVLCSWWSKESLSLLVPTSKSYFMPSA